ncbi:hypothetical protein [Absidia glauca]|uniref:Uncharacterized protein n=1 Tax=Absidia glauca TaxID=4829 RepID=A0A168LGJ3_ABSGL|nr:hypothetical protein [Absidia glauca]
MGKTIRLKTNLPQHSQLFNDLPSHQQALSIDNNTGNITEDYPRHPLSDYLFLYALALPPLPFVKID